MSQFDAGLLVDFVDQSATNRRLNSRELVFVRLGEDIYVLDDRCSHEEFPLSLGEVNADECLIECERHGAMFHLKDGTPASLPATKPVATYDVTMRDGHVWVEMS